MLKYMYDGKKEFHISKLVPEDVLKDYERKGTKRYFPSSDNLNLV
jgi:hypothetical protein